MNDLSRKIEAILFIAGEPVEFQRMADLLEVPVEEIRQSFQEIQNDYQTNKRGLALIIFDDQAQLTTAPDLGETIEKFLQKILKEDLTPAALETLSIIAYKGPISRAEIDNIRGVNSSYILRNLLIRGLINREIDPHRANAFVYKISFDFLRKMGLEKIEELPDYEKYHNL
ncbi:MAG TPA: SMC-Scp complex subunit ScpB [Candidatus Paceibacterota bacterium]|nr:SMC-Scp complex subunit ScpB [Candidatus Paceibacterota bacterium]HOL53801.1 SMC-Scp complex subunit ScpB [Candidatus Paceibacterota bacterium]HON21565.1 SMC-Scp complex subunit ScpB [Candidatus Paceibacterota bacterium]HPP16942.1 SMC-Scp complex subunit ScpB [Candidatus Paceibacterota bacterium]HRU33438.1 SMC-Scp complex subunit ScpB [Candidatus Paceibacterota bacterium]